MDGGDRVYFSDGVLRLDGRMRGSLPKGHRAVRPETFVDAVSRFPHGARFGKFGPIGSVGGDLASTARGDRMRLYLVLDDKGTHLETRQTCPAPTLPRCPLIATLVLGGTRGYEPHTSDALATFIRDGCPPGVRRVAFGARQKRDSPIVSHLRAMDGDADLRNARALTFYAGAEEELTNTSRAEIVGADSDIRVIREITILSPQTHPTTGVKRHFYASIGCWSGRPSG